ncbi:2-keto-4-pentenoate hydratase [Humitalea sp. 24SJ18S-53]|uniref:2-keto-4-pentenoate hydratase n=1 Tax=Humitalea sp. 24SJ18S-53 TaxID=3422307 RepID=UPI003D6654D7
MTTTRRGLAALALLAATPAQAACPDMAAAARVAAALIAREPLTAPIAGLTPADAECFREGVVAHLAQPWGDVVGWKAGLTNPAAQRHFGVPHPLRGAIYHATIRARSGDEIPARFGSMPVVESDLLVRVRDDAINEAGSDPVAILRHLDQVIPFIELPDLAFAPGVPLDAAALIAINVGARLGVVGDAMPAEATTDFAGRLASMSVVLSQDGNERARAPGTVLMGHPLNVIPWLVQDLARVGRRLRAGEYISLGGFSPQIPSAAGVWRLRYEGLAATAPEVVVRLT